MNHKTKFVSVFLALMLALSLALPAMAESFEYKGENPAGGEIIINKAILGAQYNVYRIFDLYDYDAEHNAYLYDVNEAWKSFIEDANGGANYVEVDETLHRVTWKTGASVAEFAEKAMKYARDNNITPVMSEKNGEAPTELEAQTTNTLTFSKLPLGYYLVDSTTGTLCELTTTNPTTTVDEKSPAPELTKDVLIENGTYNPDNIPITDDDGNLIEDDNGDSVHIGSVLTYRITIYAQPGAQKYVYHDQLGKGLTMDMNSIHVYVPGEGETEKEALTNNTDYVVHNGPGHNSLNEALGTTTTKCSWENNCSFQIQFKQDFLNTIDKETPIQIVYQATVNADAVNVVENDGKLGYGPNDTEVYTPPSEPENPLVALNIYKYAQVTATEDGTVTASNDEPLKGAEFVLTTTVPMENQSAPTENDTGILQFLPMGKEDGKYLYFPDETMEKPENYDTEYGDVTRTVVSPEEGTISLDGLSAGTYYLYETKAPTGYNQLTAPYTIIVDSDGNLTVNGVELDGDANQVRVLNQSGTLLPETGGIGTTIFYVVGGCLCVGAVVLLVTKRRMNIGRE